MKIKNPIKKSLYDAIANDDLTPDEREERVKKAIKYLSLQAELYENFKLESPELNFEPKNIKNLTNRMGNTALIMAAVKNRVPIAKLLIAAGMEVNQANKITGATPLHAAVQEGHTDSVAFLLSVKANPNQMNKKIHVAPLIIAASQGHHAIVGLLLKAGAKRDQIDEVDGGTALSMAAQEGHSTCVDLLLKAKADPNKTNDIKRTSPLYVAAANGHNAIIDRLLDEGVDIEFTRDGKTILDRAIKGKHLATATLLLQRGATVKRPDVLLHFLASEDQCDVNIPKCLDLLDEKGAEILGLVRVDAQLYTIKLEGMQKAYASLLCFLMSSEGTILVPLGIPNLIAEYGGALTAKNTITFFQPKTANAVLLELKKEIASVMEKSQTAIQFFDTTYSELRMVEDFEPLTPPTTDRKKMRCSVL